MLIGAVLKLVSKDLAEVVVGKLFDRDGRACIMRILNSIDAIILVAPIGRGVSRVAEVRAALVGDALEVMARDVGAFIVIGVINVRTVRMCDFYDLTYASGRRRAAVIKRGVVISIGNGGDLPCISVIPDLCSVILKIGVTQEHLLGRVDLVGIARAALIIMAGRRRSGREPTRRTIPA